MSHTLNFVLAHPNDAADRIEQLEAALRDVYLDVIFMVERKIIPNVLDDIIYERARAALAPEQDK